MKSNNKYLQEINRNFGGVMEINKTNNHYLREIAKNTGSVDIASHHSDNYYLKRIALNTADMDIKELLQTIAELREEVSDLEGQLANDIHLFSCCKDIVQSDDALDLFAYCKYNGEVEGNTVHFYAITSPTISSISITSDKSVISYSDDEKATLTIISLDEDDNPLPNQQIVIKNGSTILDTLQTGNDGTVEYEYSAQGLGDVTLTIECGEVSETITFEDCLTYDTTEYTTNQNKDITLPSDFEISVELMATTSYGAYPQLFIGDGQGEEYVSFGQLNMQKQGMDFHTSTSSYVPLVQNNQTPNEWYTVILIKQGDSYQFKWSNETLNHTDSTISTDKLYLISLVNGKCRNMKIKPL